MAGKVQRKRSKEKILKYTVKPVTTAPLETLKSFRCYKVVVIDSLFIKNC
jgi:hypothetical protein